MTPDIARIVKLHLAETGEPASGLAARAGVGRSTMYRILAGYAPTVAVAARLLGAAGYELRIAPTAPQDRTTPQKVSLTVDVELLLSAAKAAGFRLEPAGTAFSPQL